MCIEASKLLFTSILCTFLSELILGQTNKTNLIIDWVHRERCE